MSTGKPVVFVDLEGTLSDCNHRLHHLKAGNYDEWNEGLVDDLPRKDICDLVETLQEFTNIYIVSAKPIAYKDMAMKWLHLHTNIVWKDMFFRQEGDDRSSVDVKEEVFKIAVARKANVICAIDDRPNINAMYVKKGIPLVINAWTELDQKFINDTVYTCKAAAGIAPGIIPPPPVIPAGITFKRSVPGLLNNFAKLFQERQEEYGDAYLRHGKIMEAFFPEGILLQTSKELYYYHIFELMVIKLNRITMHLTDGKHVDDSIRDLSVYAAMYQEGIEKWQE